MSEKSQKPEQFVKMPDGELIPRDLKKFYGKDALFECKYAEICGDYCDETLKKPVAERVEGECQYVDQNKRLRIQIEGLGNVDPVSYHEAMEQMGGE